MNEYYSYYSHSHDMQDEFSDNSETQLRKEEVDRADTNDRKTQEKYPNPLYQYWMWK